MTRAVDLIAVKAALYAAPLSPSGGWACHGSRLERLYTDWLDAEARAVDLGTDLAFWSAEAHQSAYLDAAHYAACGLSPRLWTIDALGLDELAAEPDALLAALVPFLAACGPHDQPVPACPDCDRARADYLAAVAAHLTRAHGQTWTAADVTRL